MRHDRRGSAVFLLMVGTLMLLLAALTTQSGRTIELLQEQRALLAKARATRGGVGLGGAAQPVTHVVGASSGGGLNASPTADEAASAPLALRRDPPGVFPTTRGELPPELQGIDDTVNRPPGE